MQLHVLTFYKPDYYCTKIMFTKLDREHSIFITLFVHDNHLAFFGISDLKKVEHLYVVSLLLNLFTT